MIRQEFAKEPKRKFAMSMGSPMDVGYTGERSVDSSELRKAEKIEGLPMKGLSHIPILACDYQELNKAISNPDSDDAKFISVGRALDDSKKSLSVKMFRRSNYGWSLRQSEDVPIQRLPFMMAMMLNAIYRVQHKDQVQFKSDLNECLVCPEDLDFMEECFYDNHELIYKGLKEVKDLLGRIDIESLGGVCNMVG